jgi:hypothetical protein
MASCTLRCQQNANNDANRDDGRREWATEVQSAVIQGLVEEIPHRRT